MKLKVLLSILLLVVAGLHSAQAQGFRVYNSDGTVMQFSLRTDSIVFYDGIGSEQDFGPFTPVNQCIVGTWYITKTETVTFYEDGTTDYMEGATYKYFPYQGYIIIYNAYNAPINYFKVLEVTSEKMIVSTRNDSNFTIWSTIQPSQAVTSIVLNETSLELMLEKTKRLTATVYPSDAENKEVIWKSSNKSVAQVIDNGLVVAVGYGACVITCFSTDGSCVYAECNVTCSNDIDYISYCPTWYGFTYTVGSYPDYNYVQGNPRNVYLNPRDSIRITACQKERGHLINGTYYTWTLCVDTLDTKNNDDPTDDVLVHANIVYNQHTNYDGYADGADDPVCRIYLPASARPNKLGKPDTIMFVARYMYSGHGVTIETDNIIDNTSYSGRITPQSGPTAGGAAGNFYFYVNAN